MGLSSRKGSTSDWKQDCFNTPDSAIPDVENSSVETNPNTVLDNQYFVKDTLADSPTVTTGTEGDDLKNAILAYMSGSKITVTWFHSNTAETWKHTAQTDWSPTLNNVHYSFTKINNFIFALKNAFTFEYTQDTAKSALTGEGILYPYFCPNQADMFVYEVQSGVYGLYKLNEAPIRMTIKSSTCHEIRFSLLRYLTKDEYNKLLACVEDEVYFDLDNYLNTNGGFLTTDEVTTELNCDEAINTLMNYYNTTFYEGKVFKTFIDSHCLYDPYVVEFMTNLVPIAEMGGYPNQLVPEPKNWRRSFWFRLLYPDILPDSNVIYKAWSVLKRITFRTVSINALSNHCFISISQNGLHQYPPFNIPEEFDASIQTVQMEVKLYLEKGKIRPPVLLALCKSIYTTTRVAQFYFIPILIFLLKRLKSALNSGENIVLGALTSETTESTTEPCAKVCDNCIVNDQAAHDACRCTAACKGYLISDDMKILLMPEYYKADLYDIHDGSDEYLSE